MKGLELIDKLMWQNKRKDEMKDMLEVTRKWIHNHMAGAT